MAADIPHFKLNNGVLMPSVGMGCWMGSPGGAQRVYDMCANALKAGYRHFDTADGYKNEEEVGRAIRDSGIPRKEIFVTTKLNNTDHHRVREAFERSLKALDIEYVDLYLMHWPQARLPLEGDRVPGPEESPTYHETWADMVRLLGTGRVRALGVSNFGAPLLARLLAAADVAPAVNQVELHPCLPRAALRRLCADRGVLLTAYSPLGQPAAPGGAASPLLADEALAGVARRRGASAAQVALSWAVQHGIAVVPKSENPGRMKQNITLVKLDEEDMKAIDGIHEKEGKHRSLLTYHQDDGTVFGWTYEQMGWEMVTGGTAKA